MSEREDLIRITDVLLKVILHLARYTETQEMYADILEINHRLKNGSFDSK